MNFTDLAFNPLCRMSEVNRYSSVYQETYERLSDHVIDVEMMSYLIASELIQNYGEDLDLGLLLQKCLFHDVDEVITGDIPRNTKYATKKGRKEFEKIADMAISNIEEYAPSLNIRDLWKNAKEGKEGVILRIVDMLDVVKKCITEIELRGNLTFLKVVAELEKHLNYMANQSSAIDDNFSKGSSGYLKGLIISSLEDITFIRIKYKSVIERYHIRENVIESQEE